MEMIIGVVSFTALIAISFFAGMKVSDYYADRRDQAVNYALKKQYTRLLAKADADDPCQPYVSPDPDQIDSTKFL